MKHSNLILAVLFLASPAFADLPHADNLHQTDALSLRLLSISCDPVTSVDPSGTPDADCTLFQATARKPSAEEIAKRLRDYDKPGVLQVIKAQLKGCQTYVAADLPKDGSPVPDLMRQYYDLAIAACSAQDANAMLNAQKYLVREVNANRCQLRLESAKTLRFKRLQGANERSQLQPREAIPLPSPFAA